MKKFFIIMFALSAAFTASAQIERVWLTCDMNTPDGVVFNWTSKNAGSSIVRLGEAETSLKIVSTILNEAGKTFHQIRVPLTKRDCIYYYSVETDGQKSPVYSFKAFPSTENELRVASIGNLGYLKQTKNALLQTVLKSSPHLLISCGDNVPALHMNRGKPVAKDDISAYFNMIDRCPELFRSVIFMTIPGNHDKEFRSRGRKRPEAQNPVYDISATAYKKFFALPDDEWKWTFTFPDRSIKFVGLDLCHISDFGTGWQACHAFQSDSEQFVWYKNVMQNSKEKFIITFYNESNGGMRRACKGIWGTEYEMGSLAVSGYGYFMEFAQLKNGFPYINNSLNVGSHYKDKSNAVWSEPVGGFLMMRFARGKFMAELLSIEDGSLLFSKEIMSRIAK